MECRECKYFKLYTKNNGWCKNPSLNDNLPTSILVSASKPACELFDENSNQVTLDNLIKNE